MNWLWRKTTPSEPLNPSGPGSRETVPRSRRLSCAPCNVVCVLLGLVLITAAIAKSVSPAPDLFLTSAGFAMWLQLVEVALGISIGLWLVSRTWPVPAWCSATGLFLILAGISLWKAASGQTDCGCFGARLSLSPWYSAAISLGALGSLLWLDPAPLKRLAPRSNAARLAVLSPFFLSLAGWSTFLTAASWPTLLDDGGQQIAPGKHVLLDPPDWVGKRFPLLAHIDRGAQLAEAEWLVVLYHHECPKCRELLSRIEAAQQQGRALRRPLALVQMAPCGLPSQGSDAPQDRLIHANLRPGPIWHVQAPVILSLKDGQVTSVADEEDIFERASP